MLYGCHMFLAGVRRITNRLSQPRKYIFNISLIL